MDGHRHLDRVHTLTASSMAECKASISLLRERRAALISAAVTGKIDVRATASDAQAVLDDAA